MVNTFKASLGTSVNSSAFGFKLETVTCGTDVSEHDNLEILGHYVLVHLVG